MWLRPPRLAAAVEARLAAARCVAAEVVVVLPLPAWAAASGLPVERPVLQSLREAERLRVAITVRGASRQ